MMELMEGTVLESVYLADGSPISVPGEGWPLVVVSVNGQMAPVPWVKQTMPNGTIMLYNLALVGSVVIATPRDGGETGGET